MTEDKWFNFAGYLNNCIHELDHPHCPFKHYRQMDQYQHLEFMLSVGESTAINIMNCCQQQRGQCNPIVFQNPHVNLARVVAS
jgi:hypothetical protein